MIIEKRSNYWIVTLTQSPFCFLFLVWLWLVWDHSQSTFKVVSIYFVWFKMPSQTTQLWRWCFMITAVMAMTGPLMLRWQRFVSLVCFSLRAQQTFIKLLTIFLKSKEAIPHPLKTTTMKLSAFATTLSFVSLGKSYAQVDKGFCFWTTISRVSVKWTSWKVWRNFVPYLFCSMQFRKWQQGFQEQGKQKQR